MKFSKSLNVIVGMVLVIAFSVANVSAIVVAYEGFENHPLGTLVTGSSPDIGTVDWHYATWSGPGAGPDATVENTVVYGGTQALMAKRIDGDANTAQGIGGGNLQAGQTVTISTAYQSTSVYVVDAAPDPGSGNNWTDNGQSLWNMTGWTEAWDTNRHYNAYDPGVGYLDTGISASGDGKWDVLVSVMNIDAVETGIPGRELTGTWDLYISLDGAASVLAASGMTMGAFGKGTALSSYVESNWAGAPYNEQIAYFDEMSIDIVPEPMTIALLGLGALRLRRKKC